MQTQGRGQVGVSACSMIQEITTKPGNKGEEELYPIVLLHCIVNLLPMNPRTSPRLWSSALDPSDKMFLVYQLSKPCPTRYCCVCTTFGPFDGSEPTPAIFPVKLVKEGALPLCSVPDLFNF